MAKVRYFFELAAPYAAALGKGTGYVAAIVGGFWLLGLVWMHVVRPAWEHVGRPAVQAQVDAFSEGRCAKKLEGELRFADPASDFEVTKCTAAEPAGFICIVKALAKDGIYRSEPWTMAASCSLAP